MFARRQLRLRVLEELERRVKGFRAREELWPLRVPNEPIPLADVIDQALAEAGGRLDPHELRSRSLLRMEWEDGSRWEAWVIVLPSGRKLFCDSGEEESRVLASGGRNAGDESDRAFLTLLADSAGQHFGIEMSGGAPSRVWAAIPDREFLVDFFVTLFEGTPAEASLRDQLHGEARAASPRGEADGADFRTDVTVWLDRALR